MIQRIEIAADVFDLRPHLFFRCDKVADQILQLARKLRKRRQQLFVFGNFRYELNIIIKAQRRFAVYHQFFCHLDRFGFQAIRILSGLPRFGGFFGFVGQLFGLLIDALHRLDRLGIAKIEKIHIAKVIDQARKNFGELRLVDREVFQQLFVLFGKILRRLIENHLPFLHDVLLLLYKSVKLLDSIFQRFFRSLTERFVAFTQKLGHGLLRIDLALPGDDTFQSDKLIEQVNLLLLDRFESKGSRVVVDSFAPTGLGYLSENSFVLVVPQLGEPGDKSGFRLDGYFPRPGHVRSDYVLFLLHLCQMALERSQIVRIGTICVDDVVKICRQVDRDTQGCLLRFDGLIEFGKSVTARIVVGDCHFFQRFYQQHERLRAAGISRRAEILA